MLSCPRCPIVSCVRYRGENVSCSVVFGTLVGVFVFSVMWPELLIASAISCALWSSVVLSVRLPESGVCIHISGEYCVWYVCDVLYTVLYVRVICFVVCVDVLSRGGIYMLMCTLII